MKTLDELKAENAKAEKEQLQETAAEAEDFTEEATEEELDESEGLAEGKEEEDNETEVEAWAMGDPEDEPDSEHYDSGDIAAVRKKWKGRAKEAEDEVATLRAEIEKLKANPVQAKPVETKPYPKLEDFDYDEDAHQQAVIQWNDERIEAKLNQQNQSNQLNQQQQEAISKRNKAVDEHYVRAERVAKENKIEPEKYQKSDLAVRNLFESLAPGQGDDVTDNIIAALGEGSEKVMYNIGLSPAKQAKVRELSGNPMALMAYLGELKSSFTAKRSVKSNAPKPPKKLSPDGSGSATESALQKKYNKAKSVQERLDLKWKAKEANIDTSKW